MASIKGIKLTGIQSHMGAEGYTLFANVSVDGKRVGTVNDDGWGGSMEIDIAPSIVNEIVRRYREYCEDTRKVDEMELFSMTAEEFAEHKKNGTLPVVKEYDLDFFFSELAELGDLEKHYKKAVKKGYKAVVRTTYHNVRGPKPCDSVYYTNGSDTVLAKLTREAEEKSPAVTVEQFSSLDDFNIK